MMNFSIEIDSENLFPVIHLRNENTSAEVYSFGALLNSFAIKNSINIIDGFNSPQQGFDNITSGFKSAKLSPFVCRLANGKYIYNNSEYTINKFYMAGEAIHGLLYDAFFSIIDSGADNDAAFVTLEYNYNKKDEGYPFNYTCTINYRLEKDNFLWVRTTIKNNAVIAIPVCDGWHTYFTLGGRLNELLFELNAASMVEFNDKLIPSGNIIPYNRFAKPEIFGNTFLDNCFLLNENKKPACVLKNPKTGLQLSVHPQKNYPYLQLYTPENRKSIAIENLSAVPNAFNNKIGLTILEPGEDISFLTGYQVSVYL